MHHAEIKKGGRPLRFLDDAELRRGPASTWRHIPPPPSRTAGRGEKGMPLKALRVHRRQEPLRQDRRHATPVSKSKDCPTNAAASRAKRNLCARIQDAAWPQTIDRSDELSLLSSPCRRRTKRPVFIWAFNGPKDSVNGPNRNTNTDHNISPAKCFRSPKAFCHRSLFVS